MAILVPGSGQLFWSIGRQKAGRRMIWVSSYWKDELVKWADDLDRRRDQRRWSVASHAKLEKTLMLGFYAIRKLIESKKLSDQTCTSTIAVQTYERVSSRKPVTFLNWHKVDELYDFQTATTEQRDLLFVCHQFVHSYIFIPMMDDDGGLAGFFFASDRQRNKQLLSVDLANVTHAFRLVGRDYPASMSLKLNPKTGDYDVSSL